MKFRGVYTSVVLSKSISSSDSSSLYLVSFVIVTTCLLSLWQYVFCHCDIMSFVIVTVCLLSLWQYVFCHCDNMSFVIVTICLLSLWQFVFCHCDFMLWQLFLLLLCPRSQGKCRHSSKSEIDFLPISVPLFWMGRDLKNISVPLISSG